MMTCFFGRNETAGIRPILVKANEWLFAKHIYGGLGAVITDIMEENERLALQCKEEGRLYALRQIQNKEVPAAFLDIARNSEFWNMPYHDLVPTEFATELFDGGNVDMLPPDVLLKREQNDQYWQRMIEESKEVLLEHGEGVSALNADMAVDTHTVAEEESGDAEGKCIGSSVDKEDVDGHDNAERMRRRRGEIQFHYANDRVKAQYHSALTNQDHVDGNLRWVPVGQSVANQ